MAFCNSCGTTLDAGTKFCSKCGAAVSATGASPAASAPGAPGVPPKQGGNAVKIILIVVAVIVGLGIIGIGTISYIGYRIAKSAHVSQKDGNVKVETPFGTVESSQDSSAVAQDIGIDPYPGAESVAHGTSSVTFGSMHTAATQLETSDPPSQVMEYYKGKLPNATFANGQGDHYGMMSGNNNDMTTISIEPRNGKTHITISRLTRKQ